MASNKIEDDIAASNQRESDFFREHEDRERYRERDRDEWKTEAKYQQERLK